MAQGPLYRVPFRRRREGKTDYRRRLALIKSGEARVVVRQSNRNVIVQFIEYDPVGDRILAQAEARELQEKGWTGFTNNVPATYLTALLAASRAKAAGIENAVLDIGRHVPRANGRIFAAIQGVVDAGVEVPHDPKVVPGGDRLRGEHIKNGEFTGAFDATRSSIAPDAPELPAAKKKAKKDSAKPAAPAQKGGGKGGKAPKA